MTKNKARKAEIREFAEANDLKYTEAKRQLDTMGLEEGVFVVQEGVDEDGLEYHVTQSAALPKPKWEPIVPKDDSLPEWAPISSGSLGFKKGHGFKKTHTFSRPAVVPRKKRPEVELSEDDLPWFDETLSPPQEWEQDDFWLSLPVTERSRPEVIRIFKEMLNLYDTVVDQAFIPELDHTRSDAPSLIWRGNEDFVIRFGLERVASPLQDSQSFWTLRVEHQPDLPSMAHIHYSQEMSPVVVRFDAVKIHEAATPSLHVEAKKVDAVKEVFERIKHYSRTRRVGNFYSPFGSDYEIERRTHEKTKEFLQHLQERLLTIDKEKLREAVGLGPKKGNPWDFRHRE